MLSKVVPFSMASGMLGVNSAVDAAASGERQGSLSTQQACHAALVHSQRMGKNLNTGSGPSPSGNRNLFVTLILGMIYALNLEAVSLSFSALYHTEANNSLNKYDYKMQLIPL